MHANKVVGGFFLVLFCFVYTICLLVLVYIPGINPLNDISKDSYLQNTLIYSPNNDSL